MSENNSIPSEGVNLLAMRKGTHSCQECRRRKIRCLPLSDSAICQNCQSKGKRCTEQTRDVPKPATSRRMTLKQRLAKLEALVETPKQNRGGSTSGHTVSDDTPSVEHLQGVIPTTAPREKTPTENGLNINNNPLLTPQDSDGPVVSGERPGLSLFDNAIWRSDTSKSNHGNCQKVFDGPSNPRKALDVRTSAKNARVRGQLLSLIPVPHVLSDILDATDSWWYQWKPIGPIPLYLVIDEQPKSLQAFLIGALNSENPSLVGLALLCIATSLQGLDVASSELVKQLPRPPSVLLQEYLEQVDRLIISDSEYASSIEGIACIAMTSKMVENMGNVKRSWQLNHRAIACAQLLGLHRPVCHTGESEAARLRRLEAWYTLCCPDFFLSLLLDLPYATNVATLKASISGATGQKAFKFALMQVSAKIIDRNQSGLSITSESTFEIQKELDSAREAVQQAWEMLIIPPRFQRPDEQELDRIAGKFWFWQVQQSLHMPLMIRSIEDPRLYEHQVACLEACRGLLDSYQIMQTEAEPAFSLLHLVDYQVFISATLLLLGLVGYGRLESQPTAVQAEDRALVQKAVELLRRASNANNTVAWQAVQGLEKLLMLSTGECCRAADEPACPNGYIQIVVPYSGTIKISPGYLVTEESPASMLTPPSSSTNKLNFELSGAPPDNADVNNTHDFGAAPLDSLGLQGTDNSDMQRADGSMDANAWLSIDMDWENIMNIDWTTLPDIYPLT